MIDINLLRIMKKRKDFSLLYPLTQQHPTLDKTTKILLQDYKKYFDLLPSHEVLELATFVPRFRDWHPTISGKPEQWNQYVGVFKQLMSDADEEVRKMIVSDIAELDMMTQLANLASQHADGDLADGFAKINMIIDEYKLRAGMKSSSWIDTPIGELLQDEFDEAGIKWRLNCLNGSMRPLRPGDFGIIAGRPDKGKTSFLASEVTFMASQLPPDRNALWLNNESLGSRIVPRLYQAALGKTMNEMKALHQQGVLEKMYIDVVGRRDRIRVQDIHGWNNSQVEALFEEHKAGIVIFDMIDNIRGFGNEARTDLALEHMYQWARERQVKYDCIGFATSQISADGDGLMFPTLGMLKDSKTGKQGACDFQLMIGASNDPNLAMYRYMGLPKNKLPRPDGKKDPQATTIFDYLRSRYEDEPIQ